MAEKQQEQITQSFETALQHFPEEIWQSFLEKLDDSDDIINVLTAIPELCHLSSGKQCTWLIGAVMPLLHPKLLDVYSMKNCRLVSKFWRKAVDTTLETHPDLLPYNSSRLTRMTEIHFNYHSLPILKTYFKDSLKWKLDDLGDRDVIKGNPFPGRCVYIKVCSDVYKRLENQRDTTRHRFIWIRYAVPAGCYSMPFPEAVPILQLNGHHIWHLTINLPSMKYSSPETVNDVVVEPLSKSLSHLINLRSLKIISKYSTFGEASKKIRKKLFSPPASFPFKLETIDLWEFCDETLLNPYHHRFMLTLTNHDQVKKLVIRAADWKRKYVGILPNLNELCLYFVDIEKLESILNDLRNAPIQKLEMYTSGMLISDLLEILSRYQIESVIFFGKIIESDINDGDDTDEMSARKARKTRRSARANKPMDMEERVASVPSVTRLSLKLENLPKRGFQFLKSFQSLQYLTIEIMRQEAEFGDPQNIEPTCYERSDDVLLKSLYKIIYKQEHGHSGHFESIWKMFPNLKMITVNGRMDMFQYVRETTKVYSTKSCHRCSIQQYIMRKQLSLLCTS